MNSPISKIDSDRPHQSWQEACQRRAQIIRRCCRGETKAVKGSCWHSIDPIVATNSARCGTSVERSSAVSCSLTLRERADVHGSRIGRIYHTGPTGPNFARRGRSQMRCLMNALVLLIQPNEFESFECRDRLTTVPNITTDSPLSLLSSEQVHLFGTPNKTMKKLGNNTKVNKVLSDVYFGGWQPSRASKEIGEALEKSPRSKDAALNEPLNRGDSRIGVSYGNQY